MPCLLIARYVSGISMELKPETAVVRPCDSGMAFDHTAFFTVRDCQLKLLSDIQAVICIGFQKHAAKADIFYFPGIDLALNRIFYI